uniref:Uncharacterized protein n=1 Tax=Aureoumbra lagunensis TaxID=44058 RepID=A0A7S3K185_9STRA|mmetsp:Transcript_1939/g.2933  ORF Transcript_1939/g.2933 Transcript_1939/m.2933 type:complete len:559 (+) Transcript_1939:38-1714(+)
MESLNLHVVECEGASSLALSPEGKMIVLSRVGPNGAAIVMTNSTFRCEIDGTQGCTVSGVAWSVDGTRIAAGGATAVSSQKSGGLVAVCDAETGAPVFCTHKEARIISLAFSINDRSQRIAIARIDGIIEVLDAFVGDPIQRICLRGVSLGGEASWINPSGLQTPNSNRTPFSGLTSDLPATPMSGTPPTPCNCVAFSADGDRLAVAHGTAASMLDLNMATLLPCGNTHQKDISNDHYLADDVQTILCTARLSENDHLIAAVALPPRSSDPQLLAFCGGPRVAIARADTGQLIAERRLDEFSSGGNNWAYALSVAFCPPSISPGGGQQQANAPGSKLRLIVGGELASQRNTGGAIAILDAAQGNMLAVHQARSVVCCVAVSADGRSMALGERRNTDVAAQQQRAQLAAQQAAVQQTKQHLSRGELQPSSQSIPDTATPMQQSEMRPQQNQSSTIGNRLETPQPKHSEEDRGLYLLHTALEQHKARILSAINADATIAQRLSPVLEAECTRHYKLINDLFSAERTLKLWKKDGFMTKKDQTDQPIPQQPVASNSQASQP